MPEKIQTALASFGMSGRVFHGPTLKVNPDFEVMKILERTKTESVKMFPDSKIVRSYDEILEDGNIRLVIVNTPDALHFSMAKAAIEAGKHVVVEKPFTLTSGEAVELINLAKENNVLLTVYQNRRWDGDFLTVQKMIRENVIGRIVEFESHYDRYRKVVTDTWKEKGGVYGGVLFSLGTHMIDQALILFGKPKTVTAHLDILRNNGKTADYYDIRFQYNGFAAILKCSLLVSEPGPRYIIHGTDGSFLKWGIDPQEEALSAGASPGGKDWGKDPEKNWGLLNSESGAVRGKRKIETIAGDYRLFYVNLSRAIRKEEELAVKPEEALSVIEMAEACLLSNRLKKTIKI